jgi:cytochrome c peroxidase
MVMQVLKALQMSIVAIRKKSRSSLAVFAAMTFLALMMPRGAAAFTVAQGNLVTQGFQVFNTQTFNGNGRTCTTCHIPADDYTISPADIAGLPAAAHKLVLGGTNTTLENPILVNKFAAFNIDNNTPGAPGTGSTPTGPFRTSMQISGLALTTLNDCPDATLIATADDSGATAQITTVKPPVYPFVAGEKINIGGVSVAGYNGIGIFKISSVINPTTFQYVKQFAPPPANLITGLAAGSGGAVNGLPATGAGVCTTAPNFVTFPVDTGTRSIELGWAGEGAPDDRTLFTPTGTTDFNCAGTVDASEANSTDLTSVLGAFSMGAVRHHFARTNARIPGIDFRCPTSTELSQMTAFQEYLGRQYPTGTPLELALKAGTSFPGTQVSTLQPVITFNDTTAELGKDIFLDPNAGCQFCHFNGGASLSASNVRTEPFGNPPLPFPGRNENEEQNVDLLTTTTFEIPSTGEIVTGGLDGLTTVSFGGTDPGDGSPVVGAQAPNGIPIFNVQSIIEAPRKKSFFHNGAFTTSIEDAESFYFTDAFAANLNSAVFTTGTNIIDGSPDPLAPGLPNPLPRGTGQPEAAIPGGPALALSTLAGIYFPSDSVEGDVLTSDGGQDVLNTMGFFLRALSSVYSIIDAERLTQDTIFLMNADQPTTVQALNFSNDVNDVIKVLRQAKVTLPTAYGKLLTKIPVLAAQFQLAVTHKNVATLKQVLNQLQVLQQSVATISPSLS